MTYMAESALGWLDFDAAASEQAAKLIRAFDEPGTLDPIGLGTVRDIFSGLLAPGTSTIQTRLRYFFFVPWICEGLERDRVKPADFARRLRQDEATLIQRLRHLGPNKGVQGFDAGSSLRRMPSEAYWGGLRSWGIRRLDLSIRDYGRRIETFAGRSVERDDDGNPIGRATAMWSVGIPIPDDFLDVDETFDLSEREAGRIVDAITFRHPASLFAAACRFPAVAKDSELPWDVPDTTFDDSLREVIRHARCLSELTAGPQHAYNLALARHAAADLSWDTSELQGTFEGKIRSWADQVADRHEPLLAWARDLPAFWDLISRYGSVTERTRVFISAMVVAAAEDPLRFLSDEHLADLIQARELQLKARRARLTHRSALENWNRVEFGGQLTYRWGTMRSYLEDIGNALPAGS